MEGSVLSTLNNLRYKEFIVGIVFGFMVPLIMSSNMTDKLRGIFITNVSSSNTDPSYSSDSRAIYVEISGAVNSPGVYTLSPNSRVGDLITLGGGISSSASNDWVIRNINSAKALEDQQKIHIPFEWDIVENSTVALSKLPNKQVGSNNNSTDISVSEDVSTNNDHYLKVNVNLASLDELKSLSGVGDVYSQKIINGRPYEDLEDFKNNSGVSNTTIEKIVSDISF